MLVCSFNLGLYAAIAWALASLGYGIGVALHRTPLPGGHGSSWGGYLMSYGLASAGLVAVLGGADALNRIVGLVQSSLGNTSFQCETLPLIYLEVAQKAFTILMTITAVGMGTAIIPIIGPAIANVFSVVATFPGLALSFTLITSMTLLVFLTVFGSLAVVLAPVGLALMAVPAGKLKGIGAWLIAAGLVFVAAGPYVPQVGIIACNIGGVESCDLGEITGISMNLNDVYSLVSWLFDPKNNTLMKMWRFALGSLAGWGILMAAAAALSKGIGGVAASLGFG